MDFWTILVLAVPEHRASSLSVLAFFHFCHPGLLGREMSWWVKFLQCKHEDFSSDPSQAKGQEQLHPRVIPAQKSGDQRIMGYLAIHFTPTLGSRFNERLLTQRIRWRILEGDAQHWFLTFRWITTGTHICTCRYFTPINTHMHAYMTYAHRPQ